jgi:N-acetyl-anhydromuramyl-L-alanine amidase AmpD
MLLRHLLVGFSAVLACSAGGEVPGARGQSPQAESFEPQAEARAWQSIVLHHSATIGGSVAAIDADHRRRRDAAGQPWLGIGYHFVVGNGRSMDDGRIEPTFRWHRQLAGAHAGRHEQNDLGIGICLIGNFDERPPTEKQLAALSRLLMALSTRYAIPRERVLRHLDVQNTQCPGKLFPWEQVLAGLPEERGS